MTSSAFLLGSMRSTRHARLATVPNRLLQTWRSVPGPVMRWASVVLAVLTVVATLLLIGDFGVTLANSVGDDSPAVFSRLLLDSSFLSGDIIASYARVYALGTNVHWGPALLLRTFGISPETSALVLVLMQNVLLVCGVYALARVASEDRAPAWIAAIFARAAVLNEL